jgi:hypothetical protein
MKKNFLLIIFTFIVIAPAIAQNYYSNTDDLIKAQKANDQGTISAGTVQNVPEGMEVIQVSPGYSILAPKGMKLVKSGQELLPEQINQYSARRFEEMEQRFNKDEARITELEQDIEQLKSDLKELGIKLKSQ